MNEPTDTTIRQAAPARASGRGPGMSLRSDRFLTGHWRFAAETMLELGRRVPRLLRFARSLPLVLLYHGIPTASQSSEIDASAFERQLRFMQQYYELVSIDELGGPPVRTGRIRVALTFDDGFRNNAEVAAPILRRYGVPAAFYVCSRHAREDEYLWVSYLDMLRRYYPHRDIVWAGERFDMRAERRTDSVERLRRTLRSLEPHPQAMYDAIRDELPRPEDFVPAAALADRYAGLTAEQVGELANDPLFTVGVHTSDHPMLPSCDDREIARQIDDNRAWIERCTGLVCDTIAYPSGAYDRRVLEHCETAGFRQGMAVVPEFDRSAALEVPRMGVYARSVAALGFKIRWGSTMRRLNVAVG